MAHANQQRFVESMQMVFASYFFKTTVLEVGSLNINGSVRQFFKEPKYYVGCDLGPGPGVDIVCPCHELVFPYNMFDVAISCECLEHDKHWEKTFQKMWDLTREQGLMIITCATTGREEHGTKALHSDQAPFTNDYYKNLTVEDFQKSFDLNKMFYLFTAYPCGTDLYFWGIVR